MSMHIRKKRLVLNLHVIEVGVTVGDNAKPE